MHLCQMNSGGGQVFGAQGCQIKYKTSMQYLGHTKKSYIIYLNGINLYCHVRFTDERFGIPGD